MLNIRRTGLTALALVVAIGVGWHAKTIAQEHFVCWSCDRLRSRDIGRILGQSSLQGRRQPSMEPHVQQRDLQCEYDQSRICEERVRTCRVSS